MSPKEEWEREEERGEDVKRGDWGLEEVDRPVRSGEEGGRDMLLDNGLLTRGECCCGWATNALVCTS